jgi:transcriptional/translational regulatory protein YebC/TACO1
MTIDERLEKLTERHEALTQTVELMAAMQQAAEKQFAKQIAEILAASKQDGENIRALARIAEIHDRPLTDLES